MMLGYWCRSNALCRMISPALFAAVIRQQQTPQGLAKNNLAGCIALFAGCYSATQF